MHLSLGINAGSREEYIDRRRLTRLPVVRLRLKQLL